MPNYPRLRGLLHNVMYKDVATVYRLTSTQADDGSDDYDDTETAVYEDMPCKLSQYGKELGPWTKASGKR